MADEERPHLQRVMRSAGDDVVDAVAADSIGLWGEMSTTEVPTWNRLGAVEGLCAAAEPDEAAPVVADARVAPPAANSSDAEAAATAAVFSLRDTFLLLG